jgi:hypothetical protein
MTTNAKLYAPRDSTPIRAEGLNPEDPAVIAAIDLVRWELSLGT